MRYEVKDKFYSNATVFDKFEMVSEEDVQHKITIMESKSCKPYPIPTKLHKEHLCALLPVLTKISNTSLSQVTFPLHGPVQEETKPRSD